jgi:hypothetical protein
MAITPSRNPEAVLESTPSTNAEDTGLRQQASSLLASREGGDAQANQQAIQLAQQGLKDISGQNELTGILELMKAAQLKPEITRDQGFFSSLQTLVGDVQYQHSEEEHFFQGEPGQSEIQNVAQGQQGNSVNDGTGQPTEATNQQQLAQNDQSAPVADQSMQLIQRGLSAIASGDKLTGIVSLMQAAQANPGLISDARFQSALQTALSQGAAKGTASAADASVTLKPTNLPGPSTAAS